MNKGLVLNFLFGLMLVCISCKHNAVDQKLLGTWHSKADSSNLKITDKQFTFDDSPAPEDYFVKGDTIFTSFEGNLPYTKYVIKKLTDDQLILFTPDSTTVEFAH